MAEIKWTAGTLPVSVPQGTVQGQDKKEKEGDEVSVPVGKRHNGKLLVLVKAIDFAAFTHKLAVNERVFRKTNRGTTRKLEDVVDKMACDISFANKLKIGDPRRVQAQLDTYRDFSDIEVLMGMAYRLNKNEAGNATMGEDKFGNWTNLLSEVEELFMKWVQSDRKRLKEEANKSSKEEKASL